MKQPHLFQNVKENLYIIKEKKHQFYYVKTCKSILQKEPKSIEEMVKMFNLHYRKVAYFSSKLIKGMTIQPKKWAG